MKVNKFPPTLSIYLPNRRTLLGVIPTPQSLSINYRFPSFSTMNFEVKKKIYDERTENWIDNPIYNSVEKNNLIRISTDNKVFKYRAEELLSDEEYVISTNQNPSDPGRNFVKDANCDLSYHTSCGNFDLQSETELYNLNSRNGFSWSTGSILYTYVLANGEDSIQQSSGFVRQNNVVENALVQESFLPVQVGDIIALACRDSSSKTDGSGVRHNADYKFYYRLYFYSEANPNTCTKIQPVWTDAYEKQQITYPVLTQPNNNDAMNYNYNDANPLVRYRIEEGDLGDGIESGYIRIAAISVKKPNGYNSIITPNNHVKIFSGERRCERVKTKQTKYHPEPLIETEHSIPWWLITSVKEIGEGINAKKTVTAYSYEYILVNHNISLEDDTLPLFVPDTIVDKVTSPNFIIDCWHPSGKSEVQKKGAQRMKRGLINQILDNAPHWKIGYVSSDVITRWRTISNVSNTNIYSFLTNTVQKLYQCYIVFNVENLTINIIKQSDIVGDTNYSNLILSWRNALKSLQITDNDDNYTTALRVNSADDTYGINLINPNGTNIIYNFGSIIDRLDYIVDNDHKKPNGDIYTLKNCIEEYNRAMDGEVTNYRMYAKKLINNIKKQSDFTSKISDILTKYKTAVDKIYIIQTCNPKQEFPSIPFPLSEINDTGGKWFITENASSPDIRSCWMVSGGSSESLKHYRKVKGIVYDYWNAVKAYNECKEAVSDNLKAMKTISLKFSLNIQTLQKELSNNNNIVDDKYIPIFTPKEALEMNNYIYEGDWTDENSIFNDEYSADDIYNTLVDRYNNAKNDLEKFYSKPMYDFEADMANILTNREMGAVCKNLYLGNIIRIYNNKWIEPILLEVNINYDDFDSSKIVLSTYYNRKPKELRFCDLFNNMQQASIETPKYTFDS